MTSVCVVPPSRGPRPEKGRTPRGSECSHLTSAQVPSRWLCLFSLASVWPWRAHECSFLDIPVYPWGGGGGGGDGLCLQANTLV